MRADQAGLECVFWSAELARTCGALFNMSHSIPLTLERQTADWLKFFAFE